MNNGVENKGENSNSSEMSMFSVAVITFENKLTLERCLASVFTQIYPRIELIICDNSSCDFDRAEVCRYIEKNKRDNIKRVVIKSRDQMASPAQIRQEALDASTGEYLGVLTGNCAFAHEKVLGDIASVFADNKQMQVVFARAQVCGIERGTKDILTPREEVCSLMKQATANQQLMLMARSTEPMLYAPAVFWKRKALQLLGGYSQQYSCVPDECLWLKATKAGIRLFCLNEVLILFDHIEENDERYITRDQEYMEHNLVLDDRKHLLEDAAVWCAMDAEIVSKQLEVIRAEKLTWNTYTPWNKLIWKIEVFGDKLIGYSMKFYLLAIACMVFCLPASFLFEPYAYEIRVCFLIVMVLLSIVIMTLILAYFALKHRRRIVMLRGKE